MVAAIRRELGRNDAVAYVIAQLLGGLLGVVVAHSMFELQPLMIGVKVRTGGGQWLGEGVATFALVLTILGSVRYRPTWTPLTVAAVITAGYWFTSSTSFANPAITLARALTTSFSGIRPVDAPLFIAAQLAGALAAAAGAELLFAPDQPRHLGR